MLQIYDDQHRRIAGIDDPDDLKIEKTLSSGDKQISFSYPKTGSEIENLRAEYYIRKMWTGSYRSLRSRNRMCGLMHILTVTEIFWFSEEGFTSNIPKAG